MIQSETERQFYLAMAGVRLWYARNALPGAAPSPDYAFSETKDYDLPVEVVLTQKALKSNRRDVVHHRAAPSDNHNRVTTKPNLSALMGSNSGSQVLAEAKTEEVDQPGVVGKASGAPDTISSAAASETLPINLSVQVWMGKRFIMIARLTSDASASLQETLALNILRSLNETDPQTLGAIHWPVFNNHLVPGNSAVDFGSVLGYAMSGLGNQALLTLGMDDEIVRNAFGVDRPLDNHQQISFPHSLAEMAANSSLKRDLWHQIKSLASG